MSRRKVTGDHPQYLTGEHEIIDLTESGEMPSELIDKYNRRFESGSHSVVVRTPATRQKSRRRGARNKVSTSTSASSGWAARFSKLADVRYKDDNPDR